MKYILILLFFFSLSTMAQTLPALPKGSIPIVGGMIAGRNPDQSPKLPYLKMDGTPDRRYKVNRKKNQSRRKHIK